jgi:hypothetical protein
MLPYCRHLIAVLLDVRLVTIRKESLVVLLGSRERVEVCLWEVFVDPVMI